MDLKRYKISMWINYVSLKRLRTDIFLHKTILDLLTRTCWSRRSPPFISFSPSDSLSLHRLETFFMEKGSYPTFAPITDSIQNLNLTSKSKLSARTLNPNSTVAQSSGTFLLNPYDLNWMLSVISSRPCSLSSEIILLTTVW